MLSAAWSQPSSILPANACLSSTSGNACRDQEQGTAARWRDGSVYEAKVEAYGRAADTGKQDLVILAVKAYDLEDVARDIGHSASPRHDGDDASERHPWWYFQSTGGLSTARSCVASTQAVSCLTPSKPTASSVVSLILPRPVVAPGIVQTCGGGSLPGRRARWRRNRARQKGCRCASPAPASDRALSPIFVPNSG